MDRREAVKYISLIMGGTVVGSAAILSGCKSATGTNQNWSEEDLELIAEIADTIIPETDSPGAKEAKVGPFIALMVDDCYEAKDQAEFRKGLGLINEKAMLKYGDKFVKLSAEERTALLNELDKEQKEYTNSKTPEQATHYFRLMKELTTLGYFSSELGATKARRYTPIPGKYEACIDYKPGEKAFQYG
ncbi:MAG: gluconate 2-dehydrogenase subunit 3 family protein [Saprospiraceae bacterium]|nr:gluconate 2-dehydrogenase subunit 3 family protein [Saprospiraceae bacterium]